MVFGNRVDSQLLINMLVNKYKTIRSEDSELVYRYRTSVVACRYLKC